MHKSDNKEPNVKTLTESREPNEMINSSKGFDSNTAFIKHEEKGKLIDGKEVPSRASETTAI